jgi:hypothetical protein
MRRRYERLPVKEGRDNIILSIYDMKSGRFTCKRLIAFLAPDTNGEKSHLD